MTKKYGELANSTTKKILQQREVYIPKTWKQAMGCQDAPHWKKAWASEVGSLEDHGTFSKEVIPDVKKGKVKAYWVPRGDQLADRFTKPLSRIAFEKSRERIGLFDVESVEREFVKRS